MKKRILIDNLYCLLALIVSLSISANALASDDGYALLVQTSPPGAGSVSPGLGIHKTAVGQTVALSAVAKSGYRFLYWLGDVSMTSGPDTTVSVDSPKLVVAVFSREEFDEKLADAGIIHGGHAPGGGGRYNPIQSPGAVNPTSGVPDRFNFPFPDFPDDLGDDDIPVPGDDDIPVPGNDDIPVPGDNEVPEPATVLLLGIGSTVLLKKRGDEKSIELLSRRISGHQH